MTGVARVPAAPAQETEPPAPAQVLAGVGVEDATWHVGAAAGQYATSIVSEDGPGDEDLAHNVDPYGHNTRRSSSYGIQSRLSARALVVQGADGTRVALVKNDLYIPQDLVNTRVAGILEEHDALVEAGVIEGPVTGIDHTNLTIGASHNHTSPYYSSPSWGLWVFQDVFDIRFFEYLAQSMADAVIEASGDLVPVRMGASVNYFDGTQKNPMGPHLGDDHSPAGFPYAENDKTISVMRFDDISDPANPQPLANFVTLGEHPESLEGNNLISGDYLAPMERMADYDTGATTVFMQNNTGTAEQDEDCRSHPCSARAEFSHREYAQAERGARLMADVIHAGFKDIEDGDADTALKVIPFSTSFPVKINDKQFAPPYSHPYPSVSNCRTHKAFPTDEEPAPGVPIAGFPDCERLDPVGDVMREVVTNLPFDPGLTYESLREAGVPLPDNYGAASYSGLQETFQVHLQAIRLGDILITVCPCEQWSDQSLNIKSRADKAQNNMHLGYDWFSQCTPNDPAIEGERTCINPQNPSQTLTVGERPWRRMRAHVLNDASGWDEGFEACEPDTVNEGECPLEAESEPADLDLIKGNYTQSSFVPPEWTGDPFPAELPSDLGYEMVLPVGMANDYWGYIATYREYQQGDHYRKALTGLGAHSSDFLATRLITMGGHLNGGPDYPLNALDQAYSVDGEHQKARANVIGTDADVYVAAYDAQVPTDGGTVREVVKPENIQRFDAAQFTWVGGSNYVDDPQVVVQRKVGDEWVEAADMTGEIVVTIDFPEGDAELAQWRAGQFEWKWTATFEAFDSDIDTGRGNQTPAGTYRFVVDGHRKSTPASVSPFSEYEITSSTFEVSRWEGITVPDIKLEDDGTVSFKVGPVSWQHPSEPELDGVKEFWGRYPESEQRQELAVGPIDYPDTWATAPLPTEPPSGDKIFPRIHRTVVEGERYCFSCTFRPWLDTGDVKTATVTINRADGTVEEAPATLSDGRWRTTTPIYDGDRAYVERAGIVDTFGEINGARSTELVGVLPQPPKPTSLGFTDSSSTSGQYTDQVTLGAKLLDYQGAPIANAPLVFTLTKDDTERVYTAQTSEAGVAETTILLEDEPGEYQLSVAYEGNEQRVGSSASSTFDVLKEDTTTSLTINRNSDTRRLEAVVLDVDDSTNGVAGVPVQFIVAGELLGSALTSDSGVAFIDIAADDQRGKIYEALFSGDDYWLGSSGLQRPPLVTLSREKAGSKKVRLTGNLGSCAVFGVGEQMAGTELTLWRKTSSRFRKVGAKSLDESCSATFLVPAHKGRTYVARWAKQHPEFRSGRSNYREV